MSGGFANPIIGGGGGLVYPSVHSPDFNLIAQTGWAINKDGSAFFFNVTASGTITATAFAGTDFVINAAGMFFYSGTPAKGNLIAAIAPVSGGTDAVGNVFPQGTNFGIWNGAGALKQHFGADASGDIFLANSAGLTVIRGQASDGSLSFYSAAGLALGNLQIAIAPAAGADPAGNTYVAGITVKNDGQIVVIGANNSRIAAFISAGNPILEWLSGYANEAQPGYIQANLANIGAGNEFVELFIHGPEVSGQNDSAFIVLNSSANDASNNAFGSLAYQAATSGTVNGMLSWAQNGVYIETPPAPPAPQVAAAAGLYAASGNLEFTSGSDGQQYDTARLTVVNTGQTLSTTSDVTIMAHNVGVGTYKWRAWILYHGSAAAGAPVIGLTLATNSFNKASVSFYPNGAAAPTTSGLGTTADVTGPTFQTSEQYLMAEGIVITTAAGSITVKGHTSVAADHWVIDAGTLDIFPVVAT